MCVQNGARPVLKLLFTDAGRAPLAVGGVLEEPVDCGEDQLCWGEGLSKGGIAPEDLLVGV